MRRCGNRRRDVRRVDKRQDQRCQAAGLHGAIDGARHVDAGIEIRGIHWRGLRVKGDGDVLIELRHELVLQLLLGVSGGETADINATHRHARGDIALHRQAADDHEPDEHEHHEYDDATVARALAGTPRRRTVNGARAGAGAGL